MSKFNDHKHLGLILDKKIYFEKHINEKIIKAKKRIGIIKHLSNYLPIKTLDLMYKLLVRPHLDYCDIIYHIPSSTNGSLNSLMEKIEKIQYQAGLVITGGLQGSNRNKLYETLSCESLSGRRFIRGIIQLFKISTNLTAAYLNDKLPPLRTPTRRNSNPQINREIRSNTHRFKTSFFQNAIESRDNVIVNFHGNITFRKLKIHLLCLMRPKYKKCFQYTRSKRNKISLSVTNEFKSIEVA